MKAIAAAILLVTGTMVYAAPRPAVEYFPAPPLNGQRAPFSSAVRVGDILYLSGTIGITPDNKIPDGFDAQARQTMANIGAVLKRAGLGYDSLFKCTVMLDNIADWPAFNKIYLGYFPVGPLPARSAIGADGLALGALLEVECWAYAGPK